MIWGEGNRKIMTIYVKRSLLFAVAKAIRLMKISPVIRHNLEGLISERFDNRGGDMQFYS